MSSFVVQLNDQIKAELLHKEQAFQFLRRLLVRLTFEIAEHKRQSILLRQPPHFLVEDRPLKDLTRRTRTEAYAAMHASMTTQ